MPAGIYIRTINNLKHLSIIHRGKNNGMYGKKHSIITKKKMSKSAKKRGYTDKQLKALRYGRDNHLSKHHLDLNKGNNLKNNILKLTNSNHQKFHRLAYHYLLVKYGITEIHKYYKWFNKNILMEKNK
jgi:hypothetical protein